MTAAPAFSRLLEPGDVVPWFRAPRLGGEPGFAFDKLGGRHVLLLLFGSAAPPAAAAALEAAGAAAHLFDTGAAVFFGVSCDPADLAERRLAGRPAALNFFVDRDRSVSALFGAAEPGSDRYRPHWLLIDPMLRVAARFRLAEGAQALAALAAAMQVPPPADAPVLVVPNVLEGALCRRLIELYEAQGGAPSGVMRQVDGRTVLVADPVHKTRRDCEVTDEGLRTAMRTALTRRLVPMIRRAFQFEATRIERYIVACYDAAEEGHFNPHRDNTTTGTAHRRFAVTINLNDDFEGGDLRFPEWSRRTYRAPPGGAVVFSCSILHEAMRVTRGRRYATLPFLYDEAAAGVRAANLPSLDPAPALTSAVCSDRSAASPDP